MSQRRQFEALESRALFSGGSVSAAHVDTFVWQGQKVTANRGEYVLRLNTGYSQSAITRHGGLTDVQSMGGWGFYSVKTSLSPVEMAKFAARNTKVFAAVSPNQIYTTAAVSQSTNDPLYPLQYFLNNTGAVVPDPVASPTGSGRQQGILGADIDAEKAWGISTGNQQNIVAVLDTGIDINHPDLVDNLYKKDVMDPVTGLTQTVHGYNAIAQDFDVTDTVGHGTAVAGCIAGKGNNGLGVTGVNWNATILPIRVFANSTDTGKEDTSSVAFVRGIVYMNNLKAHGTNIVVANASLGGLKPFSRDSAEGQALSITNQLGIVFVSAAGNSSTNNDSSFYTPTRYALNNSTSITVAATDNQDNLTSFSNYGPASVQVGAPGVGIYTTAPTYASDDFTTLSYGYIDGTSFSSPITAGIIALEKAAMPTATAAQLTDALLRGVDKVSSLSGKVSTGGRVNAYNSLRALFNKTDSANLVTLGNWKGRYGRTTGLVYGQSGDSKNNLGGVLVSTSSGASTKSFANATSSDVRALQLPAVKGKLASRSTKALSASSSLTYTLDTGTAANVFTVYAAALDNKQRDQTITLADADKGFVLASVRLTTSDLKNGKYVSFDIKGKVTVTVKSNNSSSAVVGGIFLDSAAFVDPSGTNTASTVTTDTTTGGSWAGVYGSQGVYLPGDSTSLLNGAKITVSGATQKVISSDTSEASAPRRLSAYTSGNIANGFIAPLTSNSTITTNITFTDTQTRRISLYMADTQKQTTGASRVDVYDTTGRLLNSQVVSDFSKGKYVRFDTPGSVKVNITTLSGRPATLSGVFIDGTTTNFAKDTTSAGAQIASDFKTSGTFLGTYGTNGVYIPGFSGRLSATGTHTDVVSGSTTSLTALQQPTNSINRVVGNLDIGDSSTISLISGTGAESDSTSLRKVSVYAVDFENQKIVEKVELINNVTGAVLARQYLADFKNGKYVTFGVVGNVSIKVTRLSDANAVVSGVFFD